jgi:amino acid transporter
MSSEEKGFEKGQGPATPDHESVPTYGLSSDPVEPRSQEGWMTRNGLTPRSFQKRDIGGGVVDSLDRTMKTRHMHMISIGGSIGAGFFVGSGKALSTGGPASLLIDFLIVGIMMFNTVYALGELAVMFPVSGGFYTYSTRFIDPSWGFAMGWNYVMQWAVVLPLELTVCSFTIGYWNSDINVGKCKRAFAPPVRLVTNLMLSSRLDHRLLFSHRHCQHFWRSRLRRGGVLVIMP